VIAVAYFIGFQFRKNAVLQLRQRGSVICQAAVPLLLMLLGGVFQLVVNALIPSGISETVIPPVLPLQWPFFITYVIIFSLPFPLLVSELMFDTCSTYFQFYMYSQPGAGNGTAGYLHSDGSSGGMIQCWFVALCA
jgi:hypothetical protein